MRHAERIRMFVEEIWSWYARRKRRLPWRDLRVADDDERAYRILVSEVMLQQTQVPRVIVIYKRFLAQFPTLASLACATNRDVILAWRGMGYNSRALRLRDAARNILKRVTLRQAQGDTIFPRSMEELTAIPGIGPYTAAAIRNFAWNLPTPCIDTNIHRILHRTFVGPEHADGTWEMNDKELLKIAKEVLESAVSPSCHPEPVEGCVVVRQAHHDTLFPHDARNWHAALMDFGSLVQTKSNPRWDICPLTEKGIMKTTRKSYKLSTQKRVTLSLLAGRSLGKVWSKSEPGREMGGRFVPNRIFRGKIVESLRDRPQGMTLENLGAEVCMDWAKDKKPWLKSLITKLIHDGLLAKRQMRYVLRD